MKKEYARLIGEFEHWLGLARLVWRNCPFGRWSITLAVVSFTFAGCALRPPSPGDVAHGNDGPRMCTKDDTGYGVIYYFDRNDILYSVEKQDPPPPNSGWDSIHPGGNITSKDAWKLIDGNKNTPFYKDARYPFHRNVSNWYAGSAVYAIIEDDKKCPEYKCLYQAKSTEWLKRDLGPGPGFDEDCRDKTCANGVYKCGLYWCCKK